jgi:hypothetical protein
MGVPHILAAAAKAISTKANETLRGVSIANDKQSSIKRK